MATTWVDDYARALAHVYRRRDALNNNVDRVLNPYDVVKAVHATDSPYRGLKDPSAAAANKKRDGDWTGVKALWNALGTGGYISGNVQQNVDAVQDRGGGVGDIFGAIAKGVFEGGRAGLVNSPQYDEDRVFPSDWLREEGALNTGNKWADFGLGLTYDIATDPLSWVGPGAVRAIGRGIQRASGKVPKVENPVEKAVSRELELARTGAKTPVVPDNQAEDFLKKLRAQNLRNETTAARSPEDWLKFNDGGNRVEEILDPDLDVIDLPRTGSAAATSFRPKLDEPGQATLGTPTQRTALPGNTARAITMGPGAASGFAAGAAGDISPTLVPGREVVNLTTQRARVQSIMDELGAIPIREHPRDLTIDPIYRETVTQVPKTVERQVDDFEEIFDPAPITEDALTPLEQGRTVANIGKDQKASVVRKALESRPDYVVKVGQNQFTVGQLLEARGARPNQAHNINRILQNEARNLAGLHVSKIREKLDMPKPEANPLPQASRFEKVTKTVREEIMEDVRSFTRFSDADKLAWRAKYAGVLKPEEMTYILRASSVKNFETRVAKTLAQIKKEKRGFVKVAHLMQAVKAGLVEEADLQRLMKLVGARKVDDIPAKINKIYDDAIKAEEKFQRAQKRNAPKTPKKSSTKKAKATPPAAPKITPEEIDKAREVDALVNKVERSHSVDETIWDIVPERPVITGEELAQRKVQVGEDYWEKKPKIKVTPEQSRIMGVAGNVAIQKGLVDPAQWPHQTHIQRTKRTSAILGQGKGRNLRGWNKFAQSDMWRALIAESAALPRFKALKAYPRNAAMYSFVMPMLEGLEDTLKRLGVSPIIGEGQRGLPLSLHDILASLPRNLVIQHVVDYGRGMYVTRLTDAVEPVLEHSLRRGPYASYAEARAEVISRISGKINSKYRDPIEDGWYRHLENVRKVSPENADKLINEFADALFKAAPELVQRLEVNSGLAKIRLGEQVKRMTDTVIGAVTKAFKDPNVTPGDRLEIIAKVPRTINETVRKLGVDEDAALIGKVEIDAALAETTELGQHIQIKAAQRMGTAANAAERAKVTAQHSEATLDEINRVFPEVDVGERQEISMWAQIARAFNPHFRVGDMRRIYNKENTHNLDISRRFAQLGNYIARRHSTDNIGAAFSAWQHGVTNNLSEEVVAALDDMKPMLDSIFDTNKNFNLFQIYGITGDELTRWLRHFGLSDERFRIPSDVKGGDIVDVVRSFEGIDDPLSFMSRFHTAARHIVTLKTVGGHFSALGSTTGARGLFRISPKSYKTEIGPYIDFDRFYSEEQVQWLRYFNKFLEEIQPNVNNKFVQFMDSVLHGYKSGLTIYRIGHHIRNFIGDISLSYLAGVSHPKYFYKAAQTMYHQKVAFRHLDFAQKWDAIQQFGGDTGAINTSGKLSDTVVKVKLANGNTVELSYDAAWNAAHKQGLVPSYTVVEDIGGDATRTPIISALPQRLRQPAGGKVRDFFAGISTNRDHLARLTDFYHHLENSSKSAKTLEEAISKAADLTRKWHPDGSDLTHFERKYLRRVMTFYSWIRKAIPLVWEATYTRPGRVLAYPKAMYNFAEANGIDLNNFSDPFPMDQLFPDWMTENITGPIAEDEEGYWGVSPGVVQEDVFNDYFNAPWSTGLRSTVGSVVPWIKVPFEVATGNDVRTGAQINDWSEYVDRQIPFVTVANSVANTSPTGTLASLFPGGNPAGLDVHRNVQRGYENAGVDQAALINLFAGLGLQNMSRPNYIKQAQFDIRDSLRNG